MCKRKFNIPCNSKSKKCIEQCKMNRQFPEEKIPMSNKYLKRFLHFIICDAK